MSHKRIGMLYLHEIIDIIGAGQEAYMRTVLERARHSEEQGISRLMGCWKVIGSTNRWPRVVNLWEMDSWAHWALTLERQFVPDKKDPALAPWWAKATEWRSGGFDRVLEPARFSPTRAELLQAGLRSWVCIHTLARTRPGKSAQYIEWIASQLRPAAEREGLSLFGAYHVPMRSDEIVAIWAAEDFQHACRVFAAADANRIGVVHPGSDLLVESETMWLVPAEGTFLHPQSAT